MNQVPPQVPLLAADSERVRAIKTGLNRYLAAVSQSLRRQRLTTTTTTTTAEHDDLPRPRPSVRDDKLAAIADAFSTDAELITKTSVYRGKAQVQMFYASPDSPVMKDPDFCPAITDLSTLCISSDENTIAVEIKLTDTISVGDWFTFDDEAKIKRMRIYL
jgi:hypothetical protein